MPDDVRELFRTAWELPQRALIDLAAARAPYIDQSQSLNLFIAGPTIGKLSSMYVYAWKWAEDDLLPALAPGDAHPQTTVASVTAPIAVETTPLTISDDEALACSLENPENCEACQ